VLLQQPLLRRHCCRCRCCCQGVIHSCCSCGSLASHASRGGAVTAWAAWQVLRRHIRPGMRQASRPTAATAACLPAAPGCCWVD
jgi:hypothetical protein